MRSSPSRSAWTARAARWSAWSRTTAQARQGGIKAGDVILKVDGQTIETSSQVPVMVAGKKPGTPVAIEVWRNGSRQGAVGAAGGDPGERRARRFEPRAQQADETAQLGLAVRPLTQQEKRQAETDGDLLVEDVDGPAAAAGVQPGDIILGVNGAKVKSMDELRAAAKKRSGKVVALLIERDNAQIFVPVRVGLTRDSSYASMRLLLIEDDLQAAEYLVKGLRESGYSVEHSPGRPRRPGQEPVAARYDVIIADRQLPYLDGLAIITALRERSDRTPVLILSALGTVDDRVHGLKAGGDDYLTKPFAFAELLARIEALNRRGAAASETTRLKIADLELDLLARRVTRAGRNIELTTKEFQLLEYLVRHAGQTVTRTMLLEGVWNLHFDPQTNITDVHMSRLRNAIDQGFPKPLIHTVRGAGYVLKE